MREAWSSPTRTAARPGVTPRSASARTRSLTSLRIWAATALPSRTRAVTAASYRAGSRARRADAAALEVRDDLRPGAVGAVVLVSSNLEDLVDAEAGRTDQLEGAGEVGVAEVHRRAQRVVVDLLGVV